MKNNTEIELKLVVAAKSLKKLLASELMQAAVEKDSRKTVHLESSYYDTEDYALKEHGIAYRVRDKGDGTFEATVKTSQKSSSGLSERLELNLLLTENRAVTVGFKDLGLPFELSELAPNGLQKLFTTKINREIYIVKFKNAVIEMAVDKGSIVAGKKKDQIDELELELLEGEPGELLELAAQIAELVPVFTEKRSKFARGLALLGFATDLADEKFKINGENGIRTEMLSAVQLHSDKLLQLQNELLKDDFTKTAAKALAKELLYLRAYAAFGREFSDIQELESCGAVINKWLEQLQSLGAVWLLAKEWDKVSAKSSSIFENSILHTRLTESEAEILSTLKACVIQGELTAACFKLIAHFYNTAWQNEEYLQAEGTVRCIIQKWQDKLAQEETVQTEILTNAYYVLKSMQGKAFSKAAAKIKAQGKAGDAKNAAVFTVLKDIGTGTNSRVLNRDIGLLTGWLLAGKR